MKKLRLTNGKYTLIDSEVHKSISAFSWNCSRNGYACRAAKIGNKWTRVYMHRELARTPKGMSTDHINGNRLDNRKKNLRVCTHSENCKNRGNRIDNKTGYKGVFPYGNGRFRVKIKLDGKMLHVGLYDTADQAARAYNRKAKELFGKYARLNKLNKRKL